MTKMFNDNYSRFSRSFELLEAWSGPCRWHGAWKEFFVNMTLWLLHSGLRQIAQSTETIVGRVLRRTRLAPGMELTQITVPIGVLLVIFESRPDVLPQVRCAGHPFNFFKKWNSFDVAAGGVSCYRFCQWFAVKRWPWSDQYQQNADAVGHRSSGTSRCSSSCFSGRRTFPVSVCPQVSLNYLKQVSTREEISDLLTMDQYIDLVIPRGSGELVRTIQQQSRNIPVLGHSEGICHVYIDNEADIEKALKIGSL